LGGYRLRLVAAMMLLVSGAAFLVLVYAERRLAAQAAAEARRQFQAALDARYRAEAVRNAALVERCRALARRPRIHAALEDNALELLYPSADDELTDVMGGGDAPLAEDNAATLHARFYRFLNESGAVIAPPHPTAVGALPPAAEAQIRLPRLPDRQEIGFIASPDFTGPVRLSEIIATPIVSGETGETIAALVLGFAPADAAGAPADASLRNGLWLDGRLDLGSIPPDARAPLGAAVAHALAGGPADELSFLQPVAGIPSLVFVKRLNPGSAYPPAYDVSVSSLAGLATAEARLRTQVVLIGLAVLAAALVATELLARNWLSKPVERLAAESERSARFSADASHQLKTPVAVLRVGLEELLAREKLSPEECEAIANLIHQTYRLSSLIDDLLLLSRMDAGRLRLELRPVDVSRVIAGLLDDLSAQPEAEHLRIEVAVPPALHVAGDPRYTSIILHNLLENARKYNRPGGQIRIVAEAADGPAVRIAIGNTGASIPPAAQAEIFQRFHRGPTGENIPGYGLGLNLARELAHNHAGELRLVGSRDDWTEFELRLQPAPAPGNGPLPPS
jgi:signal transduction histidine kinase